MQIAQSWRLKGQRYALKGSQCDHCGEVNFPPREVCPHCEAKKATNFVFEQAPISLNELNLGASARRAAR
jgi:uncharacterized OB-fold protein